MKRIITVFLLTVFLAFTLFTFNTTVTAEEATGYWKLTGTSGSTGFAYTSIFTPEWSYKEDFTAPGSGSHFSYLKGELIHQSNFTWTQLPEKVFPGQVFPLTAKGKVVFHKDPWFTSSGLLIQFYGAMYPLYWMVGDTARPDVGISNEVTLDVKVPVGDPDKSKENHYLRLRLSIDANNIKDPFTYVYEWIPAESDTSTATSSASDSISTDELISKIWSFGRSDGTILAGAMKLGANGKILDGTGHWNETSWKFENGVLYFYGADGSSITTNYNSIKKVNGKWVISGPYAYDASITHVLNEVGSLATLTPAVTPASKATLRATTGTSSVKLEWNADTNSGNIGYNLYRAASSSGYSSTPLTDFPITDTSYTDLNVKSGKTYYYILKPVYNGNVLGTASNEVSAALSSVASGKNSIVLQIGNSYMEVNGSRQEIDPGKGTTPILHFGRTVLPIRAVVEAMGGTVGWDGNERKVTIAARGSTVEMWIDSTTISVNGSQKEIDVAPAIINGRTMVPVRFVTENLNCTLDWDGATQKVTIKY